MKRSLSIFRAKKKKMIIGGRRIYIQKDKFSA